MNEKIARIGSILALIGGIAGLIISIILVAVLFFVGSTMSVLLEATTGISALLAIYWVFAIYWLASSIVVIVGSRKMIASEKARAWSIAVIILSVIGGGTIFGLVGGILGVIATKN